MPDQNLHKLPQKSFLKALENAKGTKIFNTFYVLDKRTGKERDVLNDGEFSCAFFVGGMLTLFGLLERPHATVTTTIEKIKERGHEPINPTNLEAGDIIVWEKQTFEDGTVNEHMGFYLGDERAVSTDYQKKEATHHHYTFGQKRDGTPNRPIILAFRPRFE